MEKQVKSYITRPSKGGGTFFFTGCGHKMYSVRDKTAYHGCLCPACLMKNIHTTLYLYNSNELTEVLCNANENNDN